MQQRLRCLPPSAGAFKNLICMVTLRFPTSSSLWQRWSMLKECLSPTSHQKPDSCQQTVLAESSPGSFWVPGFGWSRQWCAVACSHFQELCPLGQILGGEHTPTLWPNQTQSNTNDIIYKSEYWERVSTWKLFSSSCLENLKREPAKDFSIIDCRLD